MSLCWFCRAVAQLCCSEVSFSSHLSFCKSLNIGEDRFAQTVYAQMVLLLRELQSDQGLHCLSFWLYLFYTSLEDTEKFLKIWIPEKILL